MKRLFKSKKPHSLATKADRRRALFHATFSDVGFLRRLWHNDGWVSPDLLRSNHPGQKRYRRYADSGIRTVVNLRNDVNKAPCLLAKERVENAGMTYVSLPLSARRAPKPAELLAVLSTMETLEHPILLHCKSGADRTGLICALYLLEKGAPLEVARKQLGLRYLHFKEFETGVLDIVLEQYEPHHGTIKIGEWIESHYDYRAAKSTFLEATEDRSKRENLHVLLKGLYRYAQYREAAWHRSFDGRAKTDTEKRRSNFYMKWIDHGILRTFWSNRAEIRHGVIRSNHPTEKRFRKEAQNGIRTIVNLRGASNEPQYFLEKDLCEELGLTLIDFPISAIKMPTKSQIKHLINVIETVEKPVLIHCKSGADRTGIAAAALILSAGGTLEDARKQLSPKFLHFRSGRKGSLDIFLDQFERESSNANQSFTSWLEK